jgi:hypothetical protein
VVSPEFTRGAIAAGRHETDQPREACMNTEQRKGRRDEIIGSAHFSIEKAIYRIMGYLILLLVCVIASYNTFLKGNYLGVFLLFIMCLIALQFLLDNLFSDRIVFYRDRVTKIWHALGSRTIYFSSARVIRNQYRTDEWVIRETRLNGKTLFLQIPISYEPSLFHSAESEGIVSILTDLAGHKTKDFWSDKTESQCAIIFALYFAVFFAFLLLIVWYRN